MSRSRSSRRSPPKLWLSSLLLVAVGCQTTEPELPAEIPPAEVLYQTGLDGLEGTRFLGLHFVDHAEAIEAFQTIIDNYPYSDYAVLAELRIADAYFDDRKWDEALSYYRDFADLHPGHERVPYTIFQSALCHERQARGPLRDQAQTRDALVYLDRLLLHHPHSEFADEAEGLWRELRTRLAQQILGIADFYRGRGDYEAAAGRYRSLLNEYPGLGLDAEALFKLGLSYREMNRPDEAERLFQAIVQNYRDSEFAADARDMIASSR